MKKMPLAGLLIFALIAVTAVPVFAGELDDAAMKGDVARVRQLLEQGADVNSGDKLKYTPLHKAAESGYADIVKLLIEKGANVSARTEYKQTPLHRVAGYHGTTQVALMLIQKGADINARDWSQDTPLHIAAECGNTKVAALLIEKGADINARNEAQKTPLHRAAQGDNSASVVALLVEKGADINARDSNGNTPAMVADQYKRSEIAAILRKTGGASVRQDFDAKLQKVAKAGAVYQDDVEVIVKLARSLTPPPVVPQGVQEEMTNGRAAFKLARQPKDYKEAEEHFRKASILAPWLPEPYFNLSVAQEKQHRWDEAKSSLEKYLIAAPGAKDAQAVKQKIAELNLLKRRWEDFDQEVNIGVILYRKGPSEYNEAILHWKKAVELFPEHPQIDQVYYNIGEAYMNQSNLDDALKYMQKSLEVNPNTDIAARYNNMGIVLERRGDRPKACTYYKKGCTLGSKVSCGNLSNCP
ncbi:MAG: Phosphocholine transferase AnkX [Syntrophorhabdus sp. PtaU1.Bin058]|nr:MAG: Phosphocholine transferase AnkX [Syntrophorhabdus sp. PtaU1.Bin058]